MDGAERHVQGWSEADARIDASHRFGDRDRYRRARGNDWSFSVAVYLACIRWNIDTCRFLDGSGEAFVLKYPGFVHRRRGTRLG